jgi:hypothetical protein
MWSVRLGLGPTVVFGVSVWRDPGIFLVVLAGRYTLLGRACTKLKGAQNFGERGKKNIWFVVRNGVPFPVLVAVILMTPTGGQASVLAGVYLCDF